MIKGFREFILRGNVIDLAVAVVIGAAFNAIVTQIVEAIFNPLIGAFFSADDLSGALVIPLWNGDGIRVGAVLAALINFLIVAVVVYFVFVMPMNRFRALTARRNAKLEEAAPSPPSETDLLIEIRDLLKAQAAGGAAGAKHAPDA